MAGYEYTLALIDKLTGPAGRASSAVDKVTDELTKGQAALAKYQRQLSSAKALGDIDGYRHYSSLVAESRQKVFALGQELERLPKSASGSTDALQSFVNVLGEGGAAAGEFVGPALAVVGASVAVAGAFAYATVKGAEMAVEATEARERMTALFDALGSGPDAGNRTIAMLDELEVRAIPGTRKQLAEVAKQFEAIGITDLDKLRGEIIATKSAAAIMGDEGAAAYEKLISRATIAAEGSGKIKLADRALSVQLREVGVTVDDVAKKYGVSSKALLASLKAGTADAGRFGTALRESVTEKGAKPLAAAANEVGEQWAKAEDNISKMFEGVDPSPAKDRLADFFTVFDQSEPSARAMKFFITGALNEFFSVAADGIHTLHHFFLDIEIYALKAYIALKPLIRAIHEVNEVLGVAKIRANGGSGEDVVKYLKTGDLGEKGKGAATIQGVVAAESAKAVGASIADGLTFGMASRLAFVYQAGAALGHAAHAGAADAAEVHSPSRKMMRLGVNLAEGAEGGIERGTPDVRSAMAALVQPPVRGSDGAPGIGGAGGRGGDARGGGKTEAHLHLHGVEKPEEVAELAVIKLTDMLESLGLQMGGAQS